MFWSPFVQELRCEFGQQVMEAKCHKVSTASVLQPRFLTIVRESGGFHRSALLRTAYYDKKRPFDWHAKQPITGRCFAQLSKGCYNKKRPGWNKVVCASHLPATISILSTRYLHTTTYKPPEQVSMQWTYPVIELDVDIVVIALLPTPD